MTFDEIWPVVVDGGRVTCDRLGAGVFIDYQFNGLRINHPHGASSGFTGTDEDRAAEWREITDEDEAKAQARRDAAKPVGWDKAAIKTPAVTPELKRRGRKAWTPPAEINDIDDAKPVECAPFTGPEADAYHKTLPPIVPSNPWAEAGLTSEQKPASGWANYGKGTSQ